ncbi:sigma-70 family RNA polymerase sigma factor [Streptomyces sp. NPDC048514]|uniref:sigma-70 family RNA polymerase sigma factor n=1 Tax=Streptomyces sp. NPDC048514 TaxID=3365564 RepID=UPI003716FFFF
MKREGARTLAEERAADALMRDIYAAHAKALQAYISKRVDGDSHLAEDLTQETFLRAMTGLDPTSLHVDELRPWLVTVARRLIIDAYRKKEARPAEMSLERLRHDVAGGDEIGRITQALVLMKAFETLKPMHRNALFEAYFNGRSSIESARLLGIAPGTMRSRTFYAIRSLKDALVAMDFLEATG